MISYRGKMVVVIKINLLSLKNIKKILFKLLYYYSWGFGVLGFWGFGVIEATEVLRP